MSHCTKHPFAFAVFALLLSGAPLSSCGGSPQSGGGPGGGSGKACQPSCEAKATGCGAPADQATANCNGLCSKSPTQEQLGCLETSSCAALAAAAPCGIGAGAGGGSGSGGGAGAQCGPSSCANAERIVGTEQVAWLAHRPNDQVCKLMSRSGSSPGGNCAGSQDCVWGTCTCPSPKVSCFTAPEGLWVAACVAGKCAPFAQACAKAIEYSATGANPLCSTP